MSGPDLTAWLRAMVEAGASDLYLTEGAPPSLRIGDDLAPCGEEILTASRLAALTEALLPPEARERLARDLELNMSFAEGAGRFRINVFRQRQSHGMVIRRVTTRIPTLEELGLPPLLGRIALLRRGLVLVVGATGSGKSTTLAAMIGHRNRAGPGHIVTIEDPIEFVHDHAACLVTQREIGVDTHSYEAALRNALRQRPDVILIGEIRDRAAMEHALNISETGHLCLATLHAANANQAIERVLSFYPALAHPQTLLSLSLNLRAILSQRLVARSGGGRVPALEILLNQGLARAMIRDGEIAELKAVMAENAQEGMQTFDQHLLALWSAGLIERAVAEAEADNQIDMRLALRQASIAGAAGGLRGLDTSGLKL